VRRRSFIALLASAAAWPLAARAQQAGAMPRIGLLSVFAESDPEGQALIRELMQGLQELGWVNGRNARIDFRFGGADAAHISTLATELIELRPDVVLAAGALAATALRQQTLSIPIVFVQVVDPVSAGFVTNLARPEGNIDGVSMVRENDGDRLRRLSGGLNQSRRTRENDINIHANQLGCERRQLIDPFRPAQFDDDVPALDPTEVAQACPQRLHPRGVSRGGAETQIADLRHLRRLLRPRPERPCGSAAEQRDELTAPYAEHADFLPCDTLVYRRFSLPQSSRQVLGLGLNRSESA
jgi:hypothetical protein